jgi:NAD(P)-dependent dehydrogenase (short-subunit alcohol dehydrogenase family)
VDNNSFQKLFDLSGRTAIVTGGTRGIGLAIAEGFACAGARLVVASRKPDACEQAAARLRELGAEAIGVPTHLGDVEALRALVQTAADTFGGIDIVVNNAANALAQPLATMNPRRSRNPSASMCRDRCSWSRRPCRICGPANTRRY